MKLGLNLNKFHQGKSNLLQELAKESNYDPFDRVLKNNDSICIGTDGIERDGHYFKWSCDLQWYYCVNCKGIHNRYDMKNSNEGK